MTDALAGPSSLVQQQRRTKASAANGDALKHDRRGFPQRTYDCRILRISPERLSFASSSGDADTKGKGTTVVIDDEEQAHALEQASEAIRDSHCVAFPTETVYGLAANALDPDAVQKIFRAKSRPADNPLIVHIGEQTMLDMLVPAAYKPSATYKALMKHLWPGPLTLLMPVDEEKVPSIVRCGLTTLGVRMPSHPVARALIVQSGLPLAAPSANVSGKPSPTTAQHVFHDMAMPSEESSGARHTGRIPFIIDGGPCDVGLESTVVDGVTEPSELRILRPGGVDVEQIEDILRSEGLLTSSIDASSVRVRVYGKDMAKDAKTESNPTTPGMKYRHYSPEAPVTLLISKGSKKAAKSVASKALGAEVAEMLQVRDAKQIIEEQVLQFSLETGKRNLNVGLMSMDGSRLTSALLLNNNAKRLIPDAADNDSQYSYSPVDLSLSASTQTERSVTYTLHGFSLGSSDHLNEAAHRLFTGLRAFDGQQSYRGEQGHGVQCDLIFVEASTQDEGVGLALMNRLNKAASQTFLVE